MPFASISARSKYQREYRAKVLAGKTEEEKAHMKELAKKRYETYKARKNGTLPKYVKPEPEQKPTEEQEDIQILSESLKKKLSKRMQESTINMIETSLKRLTINLRKSLNTLIKTPEVIREYLQTINPGSAKNIAYALTIYIYNSRLKNRKELIETYDKLHNQYREQGAYIDHQNQHEIIPGWERLTRSAIPKDDTDRLIKLVIEDVAPLRPSEYSDIAILDERPAENDFNYIYDGTLYLNKYKTVRRHGAKTIELGSRILNASNGQNWLIQDRTGKPLTAVAISKRIKEMYRVPNNTLRKSWIYYKKGEMGDTFETSHNLADMLNHRVTTQIQSYTREPEDLSDTDN